jgi:hypothetical protein
MDKGLFCIVKLSLGYCLLVPFLTACGHKSTGTYIDSGADTLTADTAATVADGAKPDSGIVGIDPDAVAKDAGLDAGVCDYSLANPACWQSHVAGSFDDPFSPDSILFDGRYLFFLDSSGAYDDSTRYDTTTTEDFASLSKGAWSRFQIEGSFRSFAFDGHYVYMLPAAEFNVFTRLPEESIVKRFAPTETSSAETMNLSKAFGTAARPIPGFAGGAFDGRYLYFAPYSVGLDTSGIAARYDTQADFTSATAWSTFDLTTLSPKATGFQGGIFDGRYVYFVPCLTTLVSTSSDGVPGSLLVRFDSTADFADAKAWESFDLSGVDPAAAGFEGGTFDGKYIYLAPGWQSYSKSIAVRFDSTAPFTIASSYAAFNIHTLSTSTMADGFSYRGATFDGKYVYFSPSSGDTIARFDSSGDFTSKSAWQGFDLSYLTFTKANHYSDFGDRYGLIGFDGKYVYVISNSTYSLYRFNAKASPSQPLPSLSKSFL